MTEWEILRGIGERYREILGENLVGIYVHGSLALGSFNWKRSDIDFLAVTDCAPGEREREALISTLLELDPLCPPKGLEMSVVLRKECLDVRYPTPFELHFSNMHKSACRADLSGYCARMKGVDPDLVSYFTVIKAAGITLCGESIAETFGEVPREYHLKSILRDVREAETDTVDSVLNLCRTLAFLRDGAVISKAGGGEWGAAQLPHEYAPLVAEALRCYKTGENAGVDARAGREFAEYMLARIDAEQLNN